MRICKKNINVNEKQANKYLDNSLKPKNALREIWKAAHNRHKTVKKSDSSTLKVSFETHKALYGTVQHIRG